MNKKLLIIGVVCLPGLAAGVYSCAHKDDFDASNRTILSERVSKAKAFFEKTYSPEAKTRNSAHAAVQTMLSGMEIEPDWEYAIFSENEYESYLEVPLISETRLGFGPVDAVDESQIRLSDRRLVVRQIKQTGELYLYTSIWIPDDDASQIAMPSLTMFDKGEFSGRIYMFHSDGLFYWGAAFEAGKYVASVTVIEPGDVAPATRSGSTSCVLVQEGSYIYVCLSDGFGGYHSCMFKEYMVINEYIYCEGGGGNGNGGGGGGGGGGSIPGGGTPPPPPGTTYTVTVTASPMEGGTVFGAGTYAANSSVTISAVPKPGFDFTGWTGSRTSSLSGFTVTMTENMTLTAHFQALVEEPSDPCASMKNKMRDPEFVAMLDELSALTSGNFEAGRAYTYSNGEYSFTIHNGMANQHEIPWGPSPSNKIDGFIHSHFSGGLPIFSASDLLTPGDWNRVGGINDLSRFSLGVVTSSGTYFMQITDLTAYQNFYNTYIDMQGLLNGLCELYIEPHTSAADAVKYLAQILEMQNTGITLMKKSGNGFRKIVVDSNNNVSELLCLL